MGFIQYQRTTGDIAAIDIFQIGRFVLLHGYVWIWTYGGITNLKAEISKNIFYFQILDADLEEFLPPIEELLEAPELASLASTKSFQFLLKLGYEHLFESLNKE